MVRGSSDLLQTPLAHDLIDELWLKVFPVSLGKGKRLFGGGTRPAAFRLLESRASPSGVIIAAYQRDGEVKLGSFWAKCRVLPSIVDQTIDGAIRLRSTGLAEAHPQKSPRRA